MRATYLVVDCSSINISIQAHVLNADSLSNLAKISLILLMRPFSVDAHYSVVGGDHFFFKDPSLLM